MRIYSGTKQQFLIDVISNSIVDKLHTSFVRETGHHVGHSELNSWKTSANEMYKILNDSEIPNNVGIAIEYQIPSTSKRIDYMITGFSNNQEGNVVIIELKQWSNGVHPTSQDAIISVNVARVRADFYGGNETVHPSYQAWSYKQLLEDFNEDIRERNIKISPCAYLHNFDDRDILDNEMYAPYVKKAPLFLKKDALKLRSFIKRFVKYGDREGKILYIIENGKIKPSKLLADTLSSLLRGNKEFVLIDNQKVVYEKSLDLVKQSNSSNDKFVLIVEGGPGTGKTVVAMNLLSQFLKFRLNSRYVTKNAAPREIYKHKLTGKFSPSRISNLFMSSGVFFNVDSNIFDVLIVDEAHRLNEKSGLFTNKGENQIKEIINAAKVSIFFLDEDQQVTIKDIGSKQEIEKWAKHFGAKLYYSELESQFRCNGSDGYLAWLDNTLQIRQTANHFLDDINFDFRVFDNLETLHETIRIQNKKYGNSRVVAGYCWDWVSKKDPEAIDINIGDYHVKWNLFSQGPKYAAFDSSIEEIGCIHTVQGLDFQYIGVIIGPDLIVRNGVVITDATKRAKTDQSIKGYKKMFKEDPLKAQKLADKIIKNTYKTLMTRGMKGCYIYCTDRETRDYFKSRISRQGSIKHYGGEGLIVS